MRPTAMPENSGGRLVPANREDAAAPLKALHQHLEDERRQDHHDRRDPVERHAQLPSIQEAAPRERS